MRKQCRRKVYNLINPVTHAIAGACITPDSVLVPVRAMELSALEEFRKGNATIEDWKILADILNVAETMAQNGIGVEVAEVCERATEALDRARTRHKTHGRIGRAAGEYEILRELYEFHDLQRKSISRSEYEKQIEATRRRILNHREDLKVTI